MHNKRIASEENVKLSLPSKTFSETSMLVCFIYMLSLELNTDSKVYKIEKEHSLWLFFEYSCYECDSFFDEFGISAAFVSQKYPVSVYGTVGELESAELSACISDERKSVTFIKKNISGKNFSQLSDLCVKIKVNNDQELDELYELFSHLSYRQDYVAIPRTLFSKDALCEFPEVNKDTYYRYLQINEDYNQAGSFLTTLTIAQQKKLWLLFLLDGVSAVEFEYVIEELKEKLFYPLFNWELSLRLALSESDISISYENGNFRVTNKNGDRIRPDYLTGTAAEKLFLKILFPVKPEQ